MRLFILLFSFFLFPHCKHKVDIENFRGYIADAGDLRLLIEDLESPWAGGGPAQKLSIFRNGYLKFDTLLFPPSLVFPDSVSLGKPNRFLLRGFRWVSRMNGWKDTLYKENDILVDYTIIGIDHTLSTSIDSCFQIKYGKHDINFYSERKKIWLSIPKYRIRFISKREVNVINSIDPYSSIRIQMDETLARELIINLAKNH